MTEEQPKISFHAYYRQPGQLERSPCNHRLFPATVKGKEESGFMFARIDRYLFGLTPTGIDMFRYFFDDPDELVNQYKWNPKVIDEIKKGAGWTGQRISFDEAMAAMKKYADIVENYTDGSILFVFSRKKVNFNVELYSTPELDFLEGFVIAAIDSHHYVDFLSIIIYECDVVEIECDYGLNEPPDDNPWGILYNGTDLTFGAHVLLPSGEPIIELP